MEHSRLVRHALTLLISNPDYVEDAREGAPIGNSTMGGVMTYTLNVPRQYTEEAVCEALVLFDEREKGE